MRWSPSRIHASMHGLHLLLVLIRIIVIVVIIGRRCRGCLLLLSGVGLLFLLLLHLTQGLPLLGELIRLRLVVSNDNVVEDSAALHLPEIEPDETKVLEGVEVVVILVVWVSDLLGLPDALVRRVGDALYRPFPLVLGVVLHRGLPLAVLLVVPVIRLLGLCVHNPLLLNPIGGLLALRVVHHGLIRPIRGLLIIWIRDLLGLQELPVIL